MAVISRGKPASGVCELGTDWIEDFSTDPAATKRRKSEGGLTPTCCQSCSVTSGLIRRRKPCLDGWIPCAHLYPAHAVRDRCGNRRDFDALRHAAFQSILQDYGDPES